LLQISHKNHRYEGARKGGEKRKPSTVEAKNIVEERKSFLFTQRNARILETRQNVAAV
jgi:hypothetical protein